LNKESVNKDNNNNKNSFKFRDLYIVLVDKTLLTNINRSNNIRIINISSIKIHEPRVDFAMKK
jgi:hypothetical protein